MIMYLCYLINLKISEVLNNKMIKYNLQVSSIDCKAGKFKDFVGGCPKGSIGSAYLKNCIECPRGSWDGSQGQPRCRGSCPAGKYGTATGATSDAVCKACSSGKYEGDIAQASCRGSCQIFRFHFILDGRLHIFHFL